MTYLLIIVFAVVAFFILMQLSITYQSNKQIGKTAPETPLISESDTARPVLLYFHSPNCGACKSMTPIIAELAENNGNVISIDASQSLETARAYNVRGTPTIIQVKEGKIAKVLLGAQSQETLKHLLT